MPDLSAVEKAVYDSCIKQVVGASGGEIKENEAKSLLKNLNQIKKLVMAVSPDAPIKDVLPQVLGEALQQIRTGKLQKRFQYVRQQQTLQAKIAFISSKPKAADQLKAFYGNLLGTYDEKNGGRYSTDVRMTSAVNQTLARLESMLREHGLFEHFTKGIDEDKVAQELSQLTLPKGKPGLTKNKAALQVAQIIHNWKAPALAEAARSGIFVPELQGYTSQQTHDPDIIRRMGFPAWYKLIYPGLNKFKTFGTLDIKDHPEFMRNKFLNITSGHHLDYDNGIDTPASSFGTNLSAKAAAQRTIHFTDALKAYEYSKKCGVRSFREQIVASGAALARMTALANEWGPNAEVNMRNVLKAIQNNAREQMDQGTLRALEGKLGSTALLGTPEQLLSEVLGKTRAPAQKNFWYNLSKWLVTLRSAASLGSSTISAQSDLVNLAGHLATMEGSSPIMQLARVAAKYYTPLSKDSELVARQSGLLAQALRAQLVSDRYGGLDTTGAAGMLSSFYFKMNALHWHDQKISNVAAALMSNHFGNLANTPHANLPMETKTWFNRYGIGQREWDAMREHVFTGGDGSKYLTPVAADNIQDSVLQKLHTYTGNLSKVEPESIRDDLRNRFTAMFTDAANSTVPRAGARERMILYRGTKPDTWEGSLLRLMGLFKTFPVAMISKILNRNIYGQPRGSLNTAMSVAVNFALYISCGAAIYALKQLVSGKSTATPDTVKGAKTLLAKSITQGGGLGYLGDVALPDDDKDGITSSLLKGLAGPILSDTGELADLANKSVRGEQKLPNAEKTLTNLGSNYVPFSNHFAGKFLFNYWIKYAILNNIDPHYTEKMNKSMEKESGTHFLIPPAVNARN